MSDAAINKVVDLAISQVGYTETGTNINKYAAYIDKNYPDFYNGKKQGVEWCDVFVDYLFLYNFGESNALAMLYQPKKSAGAGCKYSAQYYKGKSAWYTSPKKGDQIFFKNSSGAICHTGIVVSVSSGYVNTVEGNKQNGVRKCSYVIGASSIAGYGRPKWSVIPDTKPTPTPAPTPTPPKGDTIMVELRVLKKGNSGEEVKTVQRILKELGYKDAKGKALSIDGDFGTATDYAVKNFQRKKGISVDGWVGEVTWNKLLKG